MDTPTPPSYEEWSSIFGHATAGDTEHGEWLTTQEMVEQFGKSVDVVRHVLRHYKLIGRLDVRKERREDIAGALQPVPTYRIRAEEGKHESE